MRYNIIGDIHCRPVWKELVLDDAVNIFVGDYFSPYYPYPWDAQKQNFLDIIAYKEAHPQTILLIGNHDEDHWHNFRSGCSRHDYEHDREIYDLFEKHKDMFQAAYSIENRILVTHAGVSSMWYNYRVFHGDWNTDMDYETRMKLTPDIVARNVNRIFETDPKHGFDFSENCSLYNDYYGTSPTHGPMWIREQGLTSNEYCYHKNIFRNTYYIQVFGHTISEDMKYYEDDNTGRGVMYMVDCLGWTNESLLVEMKNGEVDRISHLQV